jgi:hypothetical protein
MDRRQFATLAPAALASGRIAAGFWQVDQPLDPVPEPHFPSRLHWFVWRNWELANEEQMARVLRTTPRNVLDLGYSMGLPKKRRLAPDQLRRIYITVIRQNWHLLPETQIIELLGWTREKFDFTLKEDDFLNIKLGKKPRCAELSYRTPSAAEMENAARIRETVQSVMGPAIDEPGEDLFAFIRRLSDPAYQLLRESSPSAGEIDLTSGWSIQIEGPHELLGQAARRLQRYLASAMAATVRLDSGGNKVIRIGVDPATGETPESFAIAAGENEVRIAGAAVAGAL